MLWKTHRRITERVCSDLGLSSFAVDRLVEGSLAPDKWGDYPHHYDKSETIGSRLLEARRMFLNGDASNAYFHLGVAFHYIQDANTSFAWNSRDSEKGQEWHNKYEEWVDVAYFVDDIEKLVRTAFSKDRGQMEFYLNILGLLSCKIEGKENTIGVAISNPGKDPKWDSKWGKPVVDLNFAFQICRATAKSVLGSRTNVDVQGRLFKMLGNYESKLRESEQKSAEQIVKLIQKRDKARGAKGFLSFLSTKIISGVFDALAKSSFNRYRAKKHLLRIARAYKKTTISTAKPFIDWYDVTIPQINIDTVEKKLLSIQEALSHINVDEATFRNMFHKRKLIYNVADMEFIKKTDLDELKFF